MVCEEQEIRQVVCVGKVRETFSASLTPPVAAAFVLRGSGRGAPWARLFFAAGNPALDEPSDLETASAALLRHDPLPENFGSLVTIGVPIEALELPCLRFSRTYFPKTFLI